MESLKEILNEEEISFAKTLDRGETLFEKYVKTAEQDTGSTGKKVMSGVDVWRLYDTFGFPIDLTRLMAEERGFAIDEAAVLVEEQKAKEQSRGARGKDGAAGADVIALDVHDISEIEIGHKVARTDDSYKYGTCVRVYKCIESGNIVACIKALYQKGFREKCEDGKFGIVLDKTNFYAEQGGQEYVCNVSN